VKRYWLLVVLLSLLLMGSGCAPEPGPPTVSVLPTETLAPTPFLSPTPTPAPAPRFVTLTLWIPDFLDPYVEENESAVLLEQIQAFNRLNPDIQVQILVKKATGVGGLYNLLSTARPVAPDVLPDLVILSEADLPAAAREGIIQPLTVVGVSVDDFFPFAAQGVRVDATLYGIPYLAQTEHIAYRAELTSGSSISWTQVLTENYSLIFPAAPSNGLASDALLATYLGSGGEVMDDSGAATLDRARLEELYRYFAATISQGLLEPELALTLPDAATCWALYQEGRGSLTVVPAGAYWAEPRLESVPGWIPTRDGDPVALARLWSLALVTPDPARQEAALQLAQWLAAPEQVAALATEQKFLPPRRQAIEALGLPPEDVRFLLTLLSEAQGPLPLGVDQPVRQALQAGLDALLREQVATPEEAATHALTVLRR